MRSCVWSHPSAWHTKHMNCCYHDKCNYCSIFTNTMGESLLSALQIAGEFSTSFLTADPSPADGRAALGLIPPAPGCFHAMPAACHSAPTWPARSWCSQEWLGQDSEVGMSQMQLPWPSSCSSNGFHLCQGWQWWALQTPHFLQGVGKEFA